MRGQGGRESADLSSTWPPNRHQPNEMFINIRRGEVASVAYEQTGTGDQAPRYYKGEGIDRGAEDDVARAGDNRAPSSDKHQMIGEQKTIRFSHCPFRKTYSRQAM